MDLSSFKNTASEGEWLNINHPVTGEPTDIRIKLVGMDSPELVSRQRKYASAKLSEMVSRANKRGDIPKADTEDALDASFELCCASVVAWENIEHEEGQLPCTPDNVRDVFSSHRWLMEQCSMFFQDRANYLGN